MAQGLEHATIVRHPTHTVGVADGLGLTVKSAEDGAVFKRRAQSTNGRSQSWLVAELDGVRCYVHREECGDVRIVLSTDDLYPDP